MKTIVGMVTFGNLSFTRLTVDELYRTTKEPFDLAVIIGKPGDQETLDWAIDQRAKRGIHFAVHHTNKGFPASVNDLYDFAWANHYDQIVFIGNDVICYPDAVDSLIRCARETDWEWICSSQFDVQSLWDRYPEIRHCFTGPTLNFTDFSARPWEVHKDFRAPGIEPNCIKDVRNLCLFKRSSFDKIGYDDPCFYPGGYFADNDYCKRARLAGVKACGLQESAYFHWWSRTLHQGPGGGSDNHFFENNRRYYELKWGGPFDGERYDLPFNGRPHELCPGVYLPASLKIESRAFEGAVVDHWRSR